MNMEPQSKEELLQAMKIMVSSRNWAGYLHFRRLLKLHYPDRFNWELRQMFRSLSEDDKAIYREYFNDPPESMDKQQKKLKKKARAEQLQEFQGSQRFITYEKPKLNIVKKKQLD